MTSLSSAYTLGKLWVFRSTTRMTKDLMLAMQARPTEQIMVFPVGPLKNVIVTHPEAFRTVITQPGIFAKAGNQPGSEGPRRQLVGSLWTTPNPAGGCPIRHDIIAVNGKQATRQRRVLNPAFANAALNNQIPLLRQLATAVADSWQARGQGGAVLDARKDLSNYALDVLGCVLGMSFNAGQCQETEEVRAYKCLMGEGLSIKYSVLPFLERLSFLPRNRRVSAAIAHMRSLFERSIARRREAWASDPVPPTDMLGMLLELGSEAPGLTEEELVPNLWTLFIAGHDTTAMALAWLVHVMTRYPEAQALARAEALATLERSGGVLTTDNLSQDALPYISNVINETLRLYPPAFHMMSRSATQDTELGGYLIPKDTLISLGISAINRHPDSFEDPDVFRPDRWNQKISKFHSVPFSVGPRNCVGDRLSILEQKIMLVTLLSRFELLPADDRATPPRDERVADLSFTDESIPLVFCGPKAVPFRLRELDDGAH